MLDTKDQGKKPELAAKIQGGLPVLTIHSFKRLQEAQSSWIPITVQTVVRFSQHGQKDGLQQVWVSNNPNTRNSALVLYESLLWRNGKEEGINLLQATERSSNLRYARDGTTVIYSCTWKSGEKHGIEKIHYTTPPYNLKRELTWENGKRHGYDTTYHIDGMTKSLERTWIEDHKYGAQTEYTSEGAKRKITEYDASGKQISVQHFDEEPRYGGAGRGNRR